MFKITASLFLFLSAAFALCPACSAPAQSAANPPGYDLTSPVRYKMPDELLEISGIDFNNGNTDIFYAEQDEAGKLFYGNPATKTWHSYTFGPKGDYEDVAICNGRVVLLRSDGTLFSFPLDVVQGKSGAAARESAGLLPKGEYEGLSAAGEDNRLAVLCKQCKTDKEGITGYFFRLSPDGSLSADGNFHIPAAEVEKRSGGKKSALRPSALALHPLTGEWYILSSVNKLLIVADPQFRVKGVYPFKRSGFNQPEGMAFDREGNLYISNEGSKSEPGNILMFTYRKPS
ncbi:SdiA-regulated domain-containing protein [Compostibacter hankyongensis]|uniref:SdiA-regulated family protein n=1 Tax=Compostibacter hankyongensis TaxID=1007089 RepID=A0ABP8GAV7_9BACT